MIRRHFIGATIACAGLAVAPAIRGMRGNAIHFMDSRYATSTGMFSGAYLVDVSQPYLSLWSPELVDVLSETKASISGQTTYADFLIARDNLRQFGHRVSPFGTVHIAVTGARGHVDLVNWQTV